MSRIRPSTHVIDNTGLLVSWTLASPVMNLFKTTLAKVDIFVEGKIESLELGYLPRQIGAGKKEQK